jgi:predicted N-formylglutamate amidohydrolase
MTTDDSAFEVLGDPADPAPFLFSCEHASNRVPPPYRADAADRALLDDHWGWDPGAADVTRALVDRLGGQAVLSRFSRLIADPNREPADPAFVVAAIDGQPVSFNLGVDVAERARRAERFYHPYHRAIDRALEARVARGPAVTLMSIHSFTPLFLGRAREMEVGVLFDDFDERAWRLQQALSAAGFEAALNAPYSGKPPDRLIHAAHTHGRRHSIEYLELEIRQDLIDAPARAAAVAERIAAALREIA